MKNLFSFLTENWGLKLLSLILAVLIYHTLKPAGEAALAPGGMHLTPTTK